MWQNRGQGNKEPKTKHLEIVVTILLSWKNHCPHFIELMESLSSFYWGERIVRESLSPFCWGARIIFTVVLSWKIHCEIVKWRQNELCTKSSRMLSCAEVPAHSMPPTSVNDYKLQLCVVWLANSCAVSPIMTWWRRQTLAHDLHRFSVLTLGSNAPPSRFFWPGHAWLSVLPSWC